MHPATRAAAYRDPAVSWPDALILMQDHDDVYARNLQRFGGFFV